MRTVILKNGDMVITIPKEEKELQLQHLYSLEPADKAQFDEITVLMNLVENKPTLKLIQGGKQDVRKPERQELRVSLQKRTSKE